jgi:acyl-[acyl-carrier-protein] desaturase
MTRETQTELAEMASAISLPQTGVAPLLDAAEDQRAGATLLSGETHQSQRISMTHPQEIPMRSLDSDLVNTAGPDGQANSTPLGRCISSHTESIPVELRADRPGTGLLSRAERERLVARASYALYRWYVERSQTKRNWNADRSFDWRELRQNHSPEFLAIIEGFYAVEQYAPDYTAELTRLVRRGYGRAQFQMRWGAEEEKHADLWRNVLLFSRGRTPRQIEDYTSDLRASAWRPPWDTPLQMLLYTVFQERATERIYLNTARIARGESLDPRFVCDRDPILAEAIVTIAVDEAAHFGFYLALARLHLYYFPEETLRALVDVLRNFIMPAATIVPNYDAFIRELYAADIFGPRKYGRDVARPALIALGIRAIKELEDGLRHTRDTPALDGSLRPAQVFPGCDLGVIECAVRGLFARIGEYERAVGLADIDPTVFVPVSSENGGSL